MLIFSCVALAIQTALAIAVKNTSSAIDLKAVVVKNMIFHAIAHITFKMHDAIALDAFQVEVIVAARASNVLI